MRWSLKLSKLDFTIEHRAGIKIAHVDAPIRHISTILQTVGVSREVVLREQANDKFCQCLKLEPYHGKCEYFLDDEVLIYRRRPDDNYQLIVPTRLLLT